MSAAERAGIVAEARSYIDTPWKHRGRTPGTGLDCAGVLVCVARARGYVPTGFDVPEYTGNPDGRLLRWCKLYMGGPVAKGELRPGDAVVVITDRHPQHLGIVGDHRFGGLSIIHASNSPSVSPPRVIEHRLMFSRVLRFVAGFQFPGIE